VSRKAKGEEEAEEAEEEAEEAFGRPWTDGIACDATTFDAMYIPDIPDIIPQPRHTYRNQGRSHVSRRRIRTIWSYPRMKSCNGDAPTPDVSLRHTRANIK
jgi:hypothetical protein